MAEVGAATYDSAPRSRGDARGARRDDARRRPGADRRGVYAPARRGRIHDARRHLADRLPRLGRRPASPGTSAPRTGATSSPPGRRASRASPRPKPKRFSISYHLLKVDDDARARPRAGLARRGRGDRLRDRRVAGRRLVRARGVGHVRHPLQVTRTWCGSSCRTTGRAIRCSRTTRSAASRCASRGRHRPVSARCRCHADLRRAAIPQPVPDDPRDRPGRARPGGHPPGQLRARTTHPPTACCG